MHFCFLLIAELYSIVWTCCNLVIHSPVSGHLGGSQLGTLSNKAAVNICVQVFVWAQLPVLLGKYMGEEWLNHMVGIYLIFKKKLSNYFPKQVDCVCMAGTCWHLQHLPPPPLASLFVWELSHDNSHVCEHRHEGWVPIEPKGILVAFTQNTIILHLWRAVWCSKIFHTDYLMWSKSWLNVDRVLISCTVSFFLTTRQKLGM